MKASHLKPKSMDEWAYGVLILEAIDRGLRKELENNLDYWLDSATDLHRFKREMEESNENQET